MSYDTINSKIILITFSFLWLSCSKEKGCKDLTAKNYQETAEQDDGSCIFPSLADNITGEWQMILTKKEFKDSSNTVIINSNDTVNGTATFNPDSSAVLEGEGIMFFFSSDSSTSYTWSVLNDTPILEANGVKLKYEVRTNTPTYQDWTRDSSSSESNINYQISVGITLKK